ncbi:hypothetical protein QF048_006990 [Streptomyces sp. W4I9-2]|nr:hypothetical protein [Streptomyces sp. W4I9-2]
MGLPLEDRGLLVMAYWRTDLTLRQLAPPFGVSKSAANQTLRDCRLKGDGVPPAMSGVARLHNLTLAG